MENETEKITLDDLLGMDMHQFITLEQGWQVMRVPGGWIYECYSADFQSGYAVFVPRIN